MYGCRVRGCIQLLFRHERILILERRFAAEDMNRHIPVDKYDVKIIATSERGEMAIADMAFIPHSDQIPESRLLKTQSFPGR